MSERAVILRVLVIATILVLTIRLFSIQIIDDEYKLAAQSNIVQEIVEYPYRGLVYDRNDRLLVHNQPVYDILIIPREAELKDSARVCQLLDISHQEYYAAYSKARLYSPVIPSMFYEKVPNEVFARIQDQFIDLRGFIVRARTVRGYDHTSLANVLGYVGEITARQLRQDSTGYYKSGDLLGLTGIEKEYEEFLRGSRGVSYKTVNVRGMVKGAFEDGLYDTLPVPGLDIRLTIDLELQQYAEKLMAGKTGSVVALDPKTGEILAFVSAPSYDPNEMTGRDYSHNYQKIQSDTLKPLFARPIQAMYPPGSMFKTVQALVALQENRLNSNEKIIVEGDLIGDLAPPGEYDVRKAITYSSNNFFYKVFRRIIQPGENENSFLDARIGFERWRNHVLGFGLGQTLGVDLPEEKPGSIPSLATYDRIYGQDRWRFSNIYSLSIGQGEILVTPLQMANLSAILANQGYYYVPHIIRQVGIDPRVTERINVGIDAKHYEEVIKGMAQVISMGSGRRAFIPDLPICGKTSTVQNPHGEDHSGFMGFAPMDDPQIAVAAYVENSGWGGRAAGSTASLIIEKYIKGEISRPWVETYVLKGDFADERRTTDESN